MKKFELVHAEKSAVSDKTLYRIRALRKIDNEYKLVNSGDIGGLVESSKNLSPLGSSWIHENAEVTDDAEVAENAQVFGNARVSNNAKVSGNAQVGENAEIRDSAIIGQNSKVSGDVVIGGNVLLTGNSFIGEGSIVQIGLNSHSRGSHYSRVQSSKVLQKQASSEAAR